MPRRTLDGLVTTIVHDTLTLHFASTCRHCRRLEEFHPDGKCLFDAAQFDPLTVAEWEQWARSAIDSLVRQTHTDFPYYWGKDQASFK